MYLMSCILLRCKWPIGPFAFNKLIDWLIDWWCWRRRFGCRWRRVLPVRVVQRDVPGQQSAGRRRRGALRTTAAWQVRVTWPLAGQLGLLPSAGWDTSTGQSAAKLCGWEVKADIVISLVDTCVCVCVGGWCNSWSVVNTCRLKMRDMKMRDQIAGVETAGKVSTESQSVKKCLKVVVFVCRVIPSV